MKLLANWIIALGVGGAVVGAFFQARLEQASQYFGKHDPTPPFVGTEADRALLRRLDAALAAARQAVVEKQALAEALIRGELKLVDAARRYRKLDGGPELVRAAYGPYYPHASDAELHCRNVIGFVKSHFIDDSVAQNEQARRLEQEMFRHLWAGTLRVDD